MKETAKSPIPPRNQWVVITGAPCSGKTTVIRELEKRGYPVVHETARAYIEKKLREGIPLDRIREDELAYESAILRQRAAIEKKLDPGLTIFFDRGIPDSIAYYRLTGLDDREPITLSRETRYKKIFLFERLPFESDAVRSEDDETAAQLETLVFKSYQMLGYRIVRIPVMPVIDRVNRVLENL
ncbi:MAG: ATP-binding protein [Deltaproteobacteria bacterium]|nr:ATP-binding protein [Deltaproteobacteria bacterium]